MLLWPLKVRLCACGQAGGPAFDRMINAFYDQVEADDPPYKPWLRVWTRMW